MSNYRAHSLPENQPQLESRQRRDVQSWGEPCARAAGNHWGETAGDVCSRASCHHSPCARAESVSLRNVHCSHHSSSCRSGCSHQDSCQCHANNRLANSSGHARSEKMTGRSCNLSNLTPPLCTARLKPTRQRTKNAICSILQQGEVCLEFVRLRSGSERVVDVCRISSDGMRVNISIGNNHYFFVRRQL